MDSKLSSTSTRSSKILIDAREFVHGRFTGIGRVLEGLTDALAASEIAKQVVLATYHESLIPFLLKGRENIKIEELPVSFLKSEKALSDLTREEFSLFISPYPKLPLFGCHCKSVHTIHDILDLTHPVYRKRIKSTFDSFRLKMALKKTDLTWYDSSWSLKETKEYAGFTGSNPRVRYPGIDEKFNPAGPLDKDNVLRRYGLEPAYILVVGNGLPHKNLGVILQIANLLNKRIVFVGVTENNQRYWKSKYPDRNTAWIPHVTEDDLPAIIRSAFCLAQPSSAEGYGYPPLEAMACGVPAVVSDIPVLVETTGGNALVADPRDPKTWMNAFLKLENQDAYKRQVERGLQWVGPLRGPKGWEKHISDIENLMTHS